MFQEFNFVTPNVVFGMNSVLKTGAEAKSIGATQVLLVTGPNVQKTGKVDVVLQSLADQGIAATVKIPSRNTPEPTDKIAEEVAQAARDCHADCIIGMGGGSVLDVAKMSSALLKNEGKVRDFFGKEKLSHRGIPTIMIPTTSGTGAEVTKHAIFLDEETNVKKAVASSKLLPNSAIIDPMLTLTCPRGVTAQSGFDALLHAAEPTVSKGVNPITANIGLNAVEMIAKYLPRAFADGSDLEARYYMSMGSLMAGFVLNNSGTSLVHALAYPLGGEFHLEHGKSLAPIMTSCFDYIKPARLPEFASLAKAMGEKVDGLSLHEAADAAIDAFYTLLVELELPTCLEEAGITDKSKAAKWAVDGHAERRLLSRCARDLTVEDCEKIYLGAFQQ